MSVTAILVGLGGTGSHLCEPLARLLAYHPASRGGTRLVLVDGDRFEPHNAARQLDAIPDVFKVRVAAARLDKPGIREAVEVHEHAGYLDETQARKLLREHTPGSEPERLLIVMAVDNHATRRAILRATSEYAREGRDVLVISPGNDLSDGSVMVSHVRDGVHLTPDPLECDQDGRPAHPELAKPKDRIPGGCQAETPSTPQLIGANMGAAWLTLCVIQNWLDDKTLPSMVLFNAETFQSGVVQW